MGGFGYGMPSNSKYNFSEISQGCAKDLLATVIMASNKKVFLIPTMNGKMWENKINQLNVKK